MIQVAVIGIPETLKKLDLRNERIRAGFKKGLRNVAFMIRDKARELSPKDTRALMRSIQVRGYRNGYHIHDGVHYGIYQEYGTYKMNAHPFMKPAAAFVEPHIETEIKTQIQLENDKL